MEKKQTLLYTRFPDKYAEIAGAAIQGVELFGKEFLGRNFVVVPSPRDFPDINTALVNHELDVDVYRAGLQNYFEANRDHPVFSFDLVDVPLFTMRGKNERKDVYATSWHLRDLEKGTVESNKHSAVILSKIPLFIPYTGDELQQAKAYALAFHEMGHFAGEHFCNDKTCIFSHPENRRRGLEEKAKAILASGGITVCQPCKDLMRKVGGIENDK